MGATGTSAASLALVGYSSILKGQTESNADQYQAARLDQAATYGNLKGVQAGGQMTRNLNTTLGNIDAVRAAANADPNSPTGAAISDDQETIGNQQTGITVNSILQQSRQDTADAAYYRSAAGKALFASSLSAGADILKGAVPLFGSGTSSGGTGFSLTRTGGLY
jgi:hypothetical protein